ncbi:Protein of unknown function [Bacillus wiedmannii]|nr:Protein of unknown function [Bacillus wiedmannii]
MFLFACFGFLASPA